MIFLLTLFIIISSSTTDKRAAMLLRRRQGHNCCRPTHLEIASSSSNRWHGRVRLEAEQRFGLRVDDDVVERRRKVVESGWLVDEEE